MRRFSALINIEVLNMNLPILLIATRLLLCPIVLMLAQYGESYRFWIGALLVFGVLTDIFDGIIARKQNTATEKLRRMDSQADLIFWLGILMTACILNKNFLHHNWIGITFLIGLEIACYATSLLRFGRETCTHSYMSKLFGITLTLAFFFEIVAGYSGWLFFTMVTVGCLSQLERIIITLALRDWTHDIPSVVHAFKLRQGKTIRRFKLFN